MAVIDRGNWSFRDPGSDIPNGSIIHGGNFSQAVPDTVILEGKTLTINGGNFTNVRVDPAWTVNGGNFTQVRRCAHEHQDWVDAGYLVVESGNCSHVIEVIEIAGGADVYVYADEVL